MTRRLDETLCSCAPVAVLFTMSAMLPPPPKPFEAHESFRSPRLLAKVVSGLFVLYLAATLVSAFILLEALRAGRAAMAGESISPVVFEQLSQRAGHVEWISRGLVCLCAVAFLVWTHRVASNVRSRIDITPASAVGCYFIPLINLVQPYRALADIWDASDPDPTVHRHALRSHALLLSWWLVWQASSVAAVSRLWTGQPDTYQQWVVRLSIQLIPLAASAVALALALAVVRKLTARQEAMAVALMPPARVTES